jgi:uncharacterized protein DUF3465
VTNRLASRILPGVAALLLGAALALVRLGSIDTPPPQPGSTTPGSSRFTPIRDAFRTHRSDLEVETGGRVARVLPDDREGTRHERFVLQVEPGLSVLVVHNLDLAPRVPLAAGDSVVLRGEYEWNGQGGVIHWTHRDPAHRHSPGWIRYEGTVYH